MTLEEKIKEIVLDAYKWGQCGVKISGDESFIKKWTKEVAELTAQSDTTLENIDHKLEAIQYSIELLDIKTTR